MLDTYLSQTRNLLNDTNPQERLFPEATVIQNINLARTKVASMGQCVRYLPPIAAAIQTIAVVNGGSGYGVAPTVIISAPDTIPAIPATATANLSGGSVISVTMNEPGTGYFQQPAISFSSSTLGTTALASGVLGYINCTTLNQEIYPFNAISLQSGMSQILAVRGVSYIWGTARFTAGMMGFQRYNAQYRSYGSAFTGTPSIVAQFGQGVNGTVYTYPVPDQRYQAEWDCIILPSGLINDTSPEVIPVPWQFCVPYFAAFLTLDGAGRYDDGKKMLDRYEKFMKEARAESQVGAVNSWYGRIPS